MTITNFKVDPSHTSIDFSVKHMMVSKVKGTFEDYQISLKADPDDLTTSEIEVSIDPASINTRNADRDGHLKSGDFFDVENYPKMTFKSTDVKKISGDEYEVTGDFTIKDVTKPTTFKVIFEGQGQDPWGNQVFGFSAEGKLDREDYGLTWNAALETGGVLVGKEVKFNIELEATKEA